MKSINYYINDIEFEVQYIYTPGRPGKTHKKNGDPGDPPEPEEIEIISIVAVFEDTDLLYGQRFEVDFDLLPNGVQGDIENAIVEHENMIESERGYEG